ncbi:MAG: 30S ribosomal protein S8e [Candidatus Altiarchaeota archaeon]|nr:30S ribosomal protein S8e [Candidatus Altiarchaeota archaeon]
MAITHTKDTTKVTGGQRRLHRKKKKADLGRPFVPVTVGKEARKEIRVRGGNTKIRMLKAEFANVASGTRVKKSKIIQVVENSSNPFFVRRNIITKGAIIETEAGYALVTSRPGQDGMINATPLKDYEPVKKKKKKK